MCRGPAPCRVPVLHNRCLIREEQGGARTGRGLSNEKPPSAEERRRALLWVAVVIRLLTHCKLLKIWDKKSSKSKQMISLNVPSV